MAVRAAVAALVAWAAWLRGCWELARPDRRSALAAFARGLVGVLLRPVASAGAVLVWGGLSASASLAPLALGWWLPALRGPQAMAVMVLGFSAVRAVARVALLASFGGTADALRDRREPGGAERQPVA